MPQDPSALYDAVSGLNMQMERLQGTVAALRDTTMALLLTKVGDQACTAEYERMVDVQLKALDHHRNFIFAYEEIVIPWIEILKTPPSRAPGPPSDPSPP